MLKGHVFKKQTFRSEVFAFWIDTLLDKKCGFGNYGNKMSMTYSGRNVTVADGLVCIRGRFIEEDTGTTIPVGTDNAYCKLVIEVDLDKENTETELNQVSYKIVKGTNSYPSLTQNDIVANNSGKYQYELARFRTTVNGITDFTDRRTYLDFNCIFTEMQTEYQEVLNELKEKLKKVEDGSAYILNEIEEDTISSAGGDTDVGFSFYSVTFKKIGKLVFVQCDMEISGKMSIYTNFNVPNFAKINKSYDTDKYICDNCMNDDTTQTGIGRISIVKTTKGTVCRLSFDNVGEIADYKSRTIHLDTFYILE